MQTKRASEADKAAMEALGMSPESIAECMAWREGMDLTTRLAFQHDLICAYGLGSGEDEECFCGDLDGINGWEAPSNDGMDGGK